MYKARSSEDACTIMYTEIANSSMAPSGTPLVLTARQALASSPAGPRRLVRPRLKRLRIRYLRLFVVGVFGAGSCWGFVGRSDKEEGGEGGECSRQKSWRADVAVKPIPAL